MEIVFHALKAVSIALQTYSVEDAKLDMTLLCSMDPAAL